VVSQGRKAKPDTFLYSRGTDRKRRQALQTLFVVFGVSFGPRVIKYMFGDSCRS